MSGFAKGNMKKTVRTTGLAYAQLHSSKKRIFLDMTSFCVALQSVYLVQKHQLLLFASLNSSLVIW